MFDPFHDFDTAGYLRNVRRDNDEATIKHFEHNLFRANFDQALAHLASCDVITYDHFLFLQVHSILFADYYPWAGQDRATILANSAVSKGNVMFSHPLSARLAIEYGLCLGQDKAVMTQKPGEVIGNFAFGHPFLDGNGRTMLLLHMELCYRAGFSIAWQDTNKDDYLNALSREIETPGKGILDAYLLQFKGPQLQRGSWGNSILLIKGLDGIDEINLVEGNLSDPAVAEKYRRYEAQRGYSYRYT
ncbi:Cell filamentation protein [Acidithiobacillus ferrivorans]|uniref:protein adenylyltransferase n=1 Tax=Acidithiobacillus ferrivorans TaxID=160808 RepID=A0A060UQA4_9PROT|nr:Fic family protein [Acidithiobacillus ferrivorans]CDQ10441.1 Cell filamentation protein [Acidithiobacillus ferrivorans]SMH64468.1 Cell filamentation protein [Acidithiobacillus ferrivorans]